ncbi:hypothetical protein [Marivita sp.]|uniref:hypothetical protein n=1 Tax=Marivita sp. TaxID=2003365 RepID=UPI003F7083C7
MSDYIDSMRSTFAARMSAHEGILALLGLAPSEDDAPHIYTELRGTLLACGKCYCPKSCLEWQSSGPDGPPPWCHQRQVFFDLAAACERLQAA